MNQDKPEKSTTDKMFLCLLRVQDKIILSKWYEQTTGICFASQGHGDLHIPSQSTCSYLYLWVELPD